MEDERNNRTTPTNPAPLPQEPASSSPVTSDLETDEQAVASASAEALSQMTIAQLLAGVAPMVRAYLMSGDFDRKNNVIAQQYKLTPEDQKMVVQAEIETFLGLLLVQEFPDIVWDRLPWLDTEEDRCRKMVVDVLGNIMRPARKYLGDVDALITELGGDPASFSRVELPSRTLPYDEAFIEVYKTIDPENELDEEQRGRISAIMKEQMLGKSTQEEAVQRYMRPIKLGGAEMEESAAILTASAVTNTALYTTFVEPEPESVEEEEEGGEEETETTTGSSAAPRRTKQYSDTEIRALYNGTPEEREHIAETVEKLMKMPNGRDKAIAVAFASPSVRRQPFDIIGALFYLAQDGTLLAQANEDPRYSQQVVAMLKDTETPVTTEQVIATPAEPRFVAAYLENQLIHGANLLPKDAARIALRIAVLLKKNGWNAPDIAAFDPALGAFRFTQDV